MKIFLHHPGQFIRHKDSPVAENVLYGNDESLEIKLTIPAITILRKRSTESNECNERPMDDAIDFRKKVIAEVNCTPSYWKPLFNASEIFRICNTSIELQKVYRLIQNPNAILSMSHVPCAEMLIPLVVQKNQKNEQSRFHISIDYSTTDYQEIMQLRDFDLISMFSGIGGFVGMFLGYSLLQVTELFEMANLKKFSTTFLSPISSLFLFVSSTFCGGKFA